MNHAKLQNGCFWQRLPYILIWNSACNDTNLQIPQFYPVNSQGLRRRFQLPVPLFNFHMPVFGIPWHHYILAYIFLIRLIRNLYPFFQLHQSLGMCQSGGNTEDHRAVVLLAQLKSDFHKLLRFLTVRRLQYRHFGSPCNHSCILLVLGAIKPRIIRHHKE